MCERANDNNAEVCCVCSLLVLGKEVESRLSLCRPKDTSSLEGVLLAPTGLLVELCVRPRREYFTAGGLIPFSDPPPLWPQENSNLEQTYCCHFHETKTEM